MDGSATAWVRGAGFVFGAALFWIGYFDLKDRLRPEPRRALLAAFALGGLAAALAMAIHGVYDAVVLASGALWWAAAIVLALWAFVIVRARRLTANRYSAVSAAR